MKKEDLKKTEYDDEKDPDHEVTRKKNLENFTKKMNPSKRTEFDYEEDPYDRLHRRI